MNYLLMTYVVGSVLKIESILMLMPVFTALFYNEKEGLVYLIVALISALLGFILAKNKKKLIYSGREGFYTVALAWLLMSIIGAIPFVLTGEIPDFIDALFETISGFTTTGASILTDVEALSHTSLLWRSFTHWIGGMGVIVFLLAILPTSGGYNMHLMRAESPGPQVGKLVPKIHETAKMLYIIYFAMTIIEIIALLLTGMDIFDVLCISFGSAGTGGFGIRNDSCASYTTLQQIIITVFILLFGINFNAYYFLLRSRNKKDAFKIEEVHWYLAIVFISIVLIGINIRPYFNNYATSFQQSAFQVASIITTTGYATTDFNLWPAFAKTILVLLMFIGACAGSTGGGIKVSRIMILAKTVWHEICAYIHPHEVRNITIDNKSIDKSTLRSVVNYFVLFVLIFVLSMLIISLDGYDFETNFTAIAATFNNIGPGLAKVGPTANFSFFSPLSKLVFCFDMLAGRLELYPLLLLFSPAMYRRLK